MRTPILSLARRDTRRIAHDYIQLTKPRIVILLVFTTVTAMVVAANGQPLPFVRLCATILGGTLAAAGASVLNQYLDRELDGQMARTRHRPIPAGRIAPADALLFGLGLLAWSLLVLGLLVNWLAGGLALAGAVYYVVVYTMLLKRHTALNIIIGGGAGAMPVLVGWAAMTGMLSLDALILFMIVFFWTPPHSWALSLFVNSDYQHTQVPMMPTAYGSRATRVQIVLYSLHLVLVTLLPLLLGTLGAVYAIGAALLGAGLMIESLRLLDEATGKAARRLYKYTSFYLAILLLCMVIDRLITVWL